jgi:protein-disulfide isomerase
MKLASIAFGLIGISAALVAAYASTRPAHIDDTSPVAQHSATEKIIRNYILNNPEILPEAIARLEQKQVRGLLSSVRGELEAPYHGAIGGNPQGDKTLVVFFDYRCPYCRAAKSKVDALIAADSNLRVVYRDYPILDSPGNQPLSRMAAALSLAAARQNKYVAFHDALFAAAGPINQEVLVRAARTAGLDERTAVADTITKDVNEAINRNITLGRMLGISGTPAYIIGDHVLIGGDKTEQVPAILSAMRG